MSEGLLLLKFAIVIGFVLGLSIIAERLSPRLAGLISGYPTGSAISLFFFGLENGADFASQSALYNMVGIIALQTFLYFYYIGSISFKKFEILLSSVLAIFGYIIVICILKCLQIEGYLMVLLPLASVLLFLYLFRKIPNRKIEKSVKIDKKILFFRAFVASLVLITIISIAQFVGPEWAGLFSAFPTTTFPLLLILHYTYGREYSNTVIKNIPISIISLLIYSLTVSITYPMYGIYLGTIVSFGTATSYLVLYYLWSKFRKK
ncbi:MAG: hypothetical protein WC501_05700 [Candidatus Micrarchaeia archaeon]